ncbi:L-lactate dehydrogenase [Pseudovirgaria hyperparasitica]|uniref:L-lactate dehydrogenase n=1 Tax=Pseudovirgaria hyperparasitica TaxID=470096 RepID=A0A6A6WM62_9PEZI|nr:L-lactate dehydrogenase [Pseudovirgaria hyperparasitica]KAF2763109.1 L-lactate dehydrogenase [Pseudovirgaria hyperparasitica]
MSQKWDLEKRPTYDIPDPAAPSSYQRDIYSHFRRPALSTKPSEWEAQARTKVPKPNFGYVYGAAGSGKTHKANTDAFDRYRLKPRMLVNATRRDVSVELFGERLSSPIMVGPVGVQSIMHKDAEEATARACRATGVPMVLSTAGTRTIEQVADANGDGLRWFQLYWPRPQYDDVTASLLRRAKAAGFKALVVTLDTMNLAWRPTDLDEGYLPFLLGEGCQIGFSDPVFNAVFEEQQAMDKRTIAEKLGELYDLVKRPGSVVQGLKVLANARSIQKSRAWMDVVHSATYREWKHLEILKKHWDGPIVLKGIQTIEDAHRAIDYGMAGIIVSNHGGRQLDGAIASLDALAEIGADDRVKQSGLTVLFDSGIRTGSDVLKAIALGAKAVLIGRPYMYGLAMGGQAGVEHVLRCIKADTDNQLGNLGRTSLAELSRDDLAVHEQPKL